MVAQLMYRNKGVQSTLVDIEGDMIAWRRRRRSQGELIYGDTDNLYEHLACLVVPLLGVSSILQVLDGAT
jgi:hypothetical protein